MALYRATFFFKDTNGFGWTETIYNLGQTMDQVLQSAKDLAPDRQALLGLQSFLTEVRVSDDLTKRDSQIYLPPPVRRATPPDSTSNFANDDVVVRIEASNTTTAPAFSVRRTLALRGCPLNVFGNAGAFIGNGDWNKLFGVYAKELMSTWAVRYRNKLVTAFLISGITQNPTTGVVTITTALANPFTAVDPNNQILISQVAGPKELNGLWRVSSIVNNTTFTITTNRILQIGPITGQVSLNPYDISKITAVIPIRAMTHKAGRPFDAPRGRRKARSRS